MGNIINFVKSFIMYDYESSVSLSDGCLIGTRFYSVSLAELKRYYSDFLDFCEINNFEDKIDFIMFLGILGNLEYLKYNNNEYLLNKPLTSKV